MEHCKARQVNDCWDARVKFGTGWSESMDEYGMVVRAELMGSKLQMISIVMTWRVFSRRVDEQRAEGVRDKTTLELTKKEWQQTRRTDV